MRLYWPLLIPIVLALSFIPAYSQRDKEYMPGPAKVRQLTFDVRSPSEVINEFAVASPDGQYFVVQHSEDPKLVKRPDGSQVKDFKESSNWDIYRYRVDGSEPLRLTDDVASEDQPTWSPDSKTIVYRKLNGHSFDLYLMDADGQNKRVLMVAPNR